MLAYEQLQILKCENHMPKVSGYEKSTRGQSTLKKLLSVINFQENQQIRKFSEKLMQSFKLY